MKRSRGDAVSSLGDVDLDAETEQLGEGSDESSDGIPDNFFGVVDEPLFDGSEPPLSQPQPLEPIADEVSVVSLC